MRFSWRAGVWGLLMLTMVSVVSADDKKANAKKAGEDPAATADGAKAQEDAANSLNATPAAGADSAEAAVAATADAAAEPNPSPAPAGGSKTWQEGPRWLPMPALDGNPGLFTLETGELLPKHGFDVAVGVNKISRMPGSTTILQVVPSFGFGITDRLSVFFQIDAHDHIHVDTPSQLSLSPLTIGNPQFGNTIYRSILPGTGIPPGYVEDYPFASVNGGGVGEADIGFKLGLLSERRGNPFGLSIRSDFYIPTKSGLSDLLDNEVQYGNFGYGIGVEASKYLLHHAILATLNWSYRFTRDQSFNVVTDSGTQTEILSLADQVRVGFGMLVWPEKRFQIISEYSGLIFVGKGIQNTSVGARDPVDSVTGIRIYPWKWVALDVGYRYNLNQSNHLDRNGFIVKLSGAYWPEKPREPDSLTSTCSVDRSSVMEGSGEIVQATATATDAWGHPLTYTWSSSGGRFDGTGPYVRWDPAGAAAGSYALTVRVSDGAGKTSSCSANVTVQPKPKPIPTMSCSADRSSVLVGERVQITAKVNDSSGTPLNYGWQTNGGQIIGSGASVQLDTSGLAAGTYTVTGRVENGAGGAADCSTAVNVQVPPPPPEASKIGECTFGPGSARVDNVCKRSLDDVAVRLQSDPKGKVVLTGTSDAKERNGAKVAGARAEAAKKYLTAKKGVDGQRVETRSSSGTATEPRQNRHLDIVWVPEGATY